MSEAEEQSDNDTDEYELDRRRDDEPDFEEGDI